MIPWLLDEVGEKVIILRGEPAGFKVPLVCDVHLNRHAAQDEEAAQSFTSDS